MRAAKGRKSPFYLPIMLLPVLLLAAPAPRVQAERLPIKTYTTADGLARDSVNRIVQDSHGFLWFCTTEGLSRFDGYKFTTYGTDQGLPHRNVTDLLETRDGVYWIATGAGLCRFNPTAPAPASLSLQSEGQRWRTSEERAPASEPRFIIYRPREDARANYINVLTEDRQGVVWCGTWDGLYRLEQADNRWTLSFVDIGMPTEVQADSAVMALLEDRLGALWVGSVSGLYRRLPDGRVERFTTNNGLPFNDVRALLEDGEGRLWVGTTLGLAQFIFDTDRPSVARVYTIADGLASNYIWSLFQSPDKRLWVGTSGGLSVFLPTGRRDDEGFRSYTDAHGLSDVNVEALTEDKDGNLWLGTESGGAMKIARDGLTVYRETDGLGGARIAAILESQAGELIVIDAGGFLNHFDGRRFIAVKPNLPKNISYLGWGWYQHSFQDHNGEWWVPTGEGLCRFPKVDRVEQLAHARPLAFYTTRNGLPSNEVFRLYEDSRGDIWISTSGKRDGLTRWERASGKFHRYTEADGLPSSNTPSAFREDASGNLWIGFHEGGLARYRNGRFMLFTATDGLPAGLIRALYLDHARRLWIATSRGGLARLDDPSAERPRFVTYTTAEGLSGNEVRCITEDAQGRIYIGTGRGVDRLDPTTGHIRHYTMADGLPSSELNVSFRDRHGALWFGTLQGLARLVPEPERPRQPPPILISGLRIAGVPYPVSELGETQIASIELEANQNQIQTDFLSLGYRTGEVLRYQYMLEGADREWSAPTDVRTITYANLSPGTYRFVVRAVNADGASSPTPATVAFTILRPIWQRWWFVALLALLVAVTVHRIYRYRVGRLLELERVRTRIATDLHDDIGASLSRMAILSEVVKRQLGATENGAGRMLTEMADSARELVDSMSDIVWSVDPRRDDLKNVVLRVRQFASEVLEAKGIAWEFETPPEPERVKLAPEQRRHLYLLFKEAINNVVRHADCRSVSLAIKITGHQLVAEIGDDGCGFVSLPAEEQATDARRGGHGLKNMQARAEQLGGRLSISSPLGRGTHLTMTVPLKHPMA